MSTTTKSPSQVASIATSEHNVNVWVSDDLELAPGTLVCDAADVDYVAATIAGYGYRAPYKIQEDGHYYAMFAREAE